MDIFANPITSQVISIVVAAVCGWLGAQLSRIKRRDEAIFEGLRVVLRRELIDDYERFYIRKEPLSIERRREIDEAFAAYSELGGNGTTKQLYETLKTIEISLVQKEG